MTTALTAVASVLLDWLLGGPRRFHPLAGFGIPVADWLDLSTGINPRVWPTPALPSEAWARLPEEDDGLEQAARDYYGVAHLLPVAGSQAAIQALPRLRPRARVRVLHPGYSEHLRAWNRAGHAVLPVAAKELEDALPETEVLVLSHPNNPTGARFDVEQLLHWQERLAARGGWLVVDEAFMDPLPAQHSLASHCGRPGLIVLRSLGKFFGLPAQADDWGRLDAALSSVGDMQ